jgi:hypothetical protein
LRAMHARGELRKGADPDQLATALLAAVQGGLLLTQIRRTTKPLESAVDAMLDHIESLRMPLRHPRGSSSRSLRSAI